MYGTFSVPARRPPSCPAPWIRFVSVTPAADVQRPDALRGIQLVPGDRQQIDAQLAHVHRHLAERLGGVGVDQDAALAGDARRSPRIGLSVPTSLFECMMLTSRSAG